MDMRIIDSRMRNENVAVAGILLHLRKQEERRQMARWMMFFAIIGVFIVVMSLWAVKLH